MQIGVLAFCAQAVGLRELGLNKAKQACADEHVAATRKCSAKAALRSSMNT